jgi:hypothetical protein
MYSLQLHRETIEGESFEPAIGARNIRSCPRDFFCPPETCSKGLHMGVTPTLLELTTKVAV